MALQVPIGDAIVALKWTCAGDPDPHLITFGVDNAAIADPADWVPALNIALTDGGFMDPTRFASAYTFNQVEVRYRDAGGFIPYTSTGTVAGLGGGTPPPSNCAALIRKNTSVGGRKNRGRMYLPGGFLSEDHIDINGFLSTTAINLLIEICNDSMAGLVAQDFRVLLFHNEVGDAPTEVNSFSPQPQIATQRRRMRH